MITTLFNIGLICTIILISYAPENHFNVIKQNNQFYKQIYDKTLTTDTLPNSNQEALKLLPCFTIINTDKDYIEPLDIDGINKDIIFNYNSNLESSSKYINAMINNGWEVKNLLSDNKNIIIEVCKNNQTCKIVIEEDKLKIYLKQLSSFSQN